MKKWMLIALFILFFLLGWLVLVFRTGEQASINLGKLPVVTPTPILFTKYSVPQVTRKDSYTILFVGDSMTAALGPHPYEFSLLMNEHYDQTFAIDNYSIGAKSILSLGDLIRQELPIATKVEPAIINRDFDVLIIESFGHNPLSQYPLLEGLGLQRSMLDTTMLDLMEANPNGLIIYLATIPPNENRYARNTLNLTAELSRNYAKERIAYIENFITYANIHGIPLVNVYQESFDENGNIKAYLISGDDIHPSEEGIKLIQQSVANFIIENGYLSK